MEYSVIDYIDLQVADSFVKKNKIGVGNGEARLYIGSISKRDWNLFFENFKYKAFFKKDDLEIYLNKCKFEYEQQEQVYRKDITDSWYEYYKILNNYKTERLYFDFFAANGNQDKDRYYIKSDSYEFKFYFRSILLPIITTIRIAKIKNEKNEILYYFYPYLNSHEIFNHPNKIKDEEEKIKDNQEIKITTKEQLIKARLGQGKFRDDVIHEFKVCMFTNIDDERILNASHIKPWSVSNNDERLDSDNGLLLSPTYDKLFDLGFISFEDNNKLMISFHLSSANVKRLLLKNGKIYKFNMTENRKRYLDFHRKEIFKK